MSENSKKKQPDKSLNNAAKFSGIVFKMAAIIGLLTWLGVWADGKFNLSTPVFTIVLSISGVFVSLYSLLRDLKKTDEQ